jgi:3',5'-cyclic-nucleotide phosphodiesterase
MMQNSILTPVNFGDEGWIPNKKISFSNTNLREETKTITNTTMTVKAFPLSHVKNF